MKLVIDRAKWLRGEGASQSFLIRNSDQKMCCLGFYGCEMGIDPSKMTAERAPEPNFWDSSSWLFGSSCPRQGEGTYSNDGEKLMTINDFPDMSPSEREKQITAIFAKHDIEVEFIGE